MRIIDITAKHLTIDAKIKTYIETKVEKLISYTPRHARKSAKASVNVTKKQARGGGQIECEILLDLPGKQLVAKESRDGVLAAINIAEEKMRSQIRRYKVELEKNRDKGGILSHVKRALKRR